MATPDIAGPMHGAGPTGGEQDDEAFAHNQRYQVIQLEELQCRAHAHMAARRVMKRLGLKAKAVEERLMALDCMQRAMAISAKLKGEA